MDHLPTVLIVEDQDQLRTLARRILERKGYQVLTAHHAEAALEVMAAHEGHEHIDIIVSDVVMPGINGITLAQHIRRKYPDVKIVLMSGYGSDDLESAGAGDWLDGVISKPFTPAMLVRAVQQAA